MKQPDPSIHFKISIAKSVLRIVAGVSLIMAGFPEAGTFFIVAEVLGIAEELF
jgi:hypothetical protein